jgi:thymidylate synthase ThyX
MIDSVIKNTAYPVSYGKNMKGMSAEEELPKEDVVKVLELINKMRDFNVACVQEMEAIGLHKQVANRYLEPFSHTTSLVTGTDFGNFFNLRVSKMAQPEFLELAKQMLICYKNSVPKALNKGEWHLPFYDKFVQSGLSVEDSIKVSVARCARVSYLTQDGEIDIQKDFELHDRLISSGHMSPTEHICRALDTSERHGNFVGWKQYRKTLVNENREYFDPDALLKGFEK